MWVFTNITDIIVSNTINICHIFTSPNKKGPLTACTSTIPLRRSPTLLVVFNVSKVPFTPLRLAGFTAYATTHHGLPFRSLYYIKNSHHYQKWIISFLLFTMTLSLHNITAGKNSVWHSMKLREPAPLSCETYNIVGWKPTSWVQIKSSQNWLLHSIFLEHLSSFAYNIFHFHL